MAYGDGFGCSARWPERQPIWLAPQVVGFGAASLAFLRFTHGTVGAGCCSCLATLLVGSAGGVGGLAAGAAGSVRMRLLPLILK